MVDQKHLHYPVFVMKFQVTFVACVLLIGCAYEDVPSRNFNSSNRHPSSSLAPMHLITPGKILPRVVHRTYFEASGIADIDHESERFGIVRPLGNDVYAFLASVDNKQVRNIHTEHLQSINMSVEIAWETALKNLRNNAFENKTMKPVRQTLSTRDDGENGYFCIGNEFTSSIVLLPELFTFSQKRLNSDSFLVCIAATRMIAVLPKSQANDISEFDRIIAATLHGEQDLISNRWFILDDSGLRPISANK